MICTAEAQPVQDLPASNILPQNPYWAYVKNKQGYLPLGFSLKISKDLLDPHAAASATIYDNLLLFLRPVDHHHSFAYVPYGPKLEPVFEHQGLYLEALSEALRPYLPHGCVFIRYDLPWENQWAHDEDLYDDNGNWIGPPDDRTQEFRVNFNTQHWNLQKSPADLLPKNTFFLNLRCNETELMYNMRFNTRYNIRKAIGTGVQVGEYGLERLDEWCDLYNQTSARQNIPAQRREYFADLLTDQEKDNGVAVRLIMADYNDTPLAGMFLAFSRHRGTYLLGASSTDHRHLMGSYALQWEAIKRARGRGCHEYDMFGCAPSLDRTHPLYGVHLYKKGFGGKLFHRMGCWDYPYHVDGYRMISTSRLWT